MRAGSGFTLIELMIAIAIVGALASLGYAGYESAWEKSNFRTMREFGIELALNQQLHRQRYGRYAQKIIPGGATAPDTLVVPSVSNYKVTVSYGNFRDFRAEVRLNDRSPLKLPNDCRVLIVQSNMGFQRFGSLSASNEDSSERCIPHG